VAVITDIFKRLNKNMHADEKRHCRLPERRDLAAQYLLLYEVFMRNHQNSKSTQFKWSHYRFRSGLTSSDFNPNALSRVR
jgi:hypothetical protein